MPLSYSQLRLYQSCPRQYEFSVIKKLPRGISIAESFGSSVHNTLKRWGELEEVESDNNWQLADSQLAMFDQKREANSQKLTANCLKDLWHKSFIIDTYESRIEADFHRQRGEEIMRKFYEWWSSEKRQVIGIETGFKIDVGGIVVSGRIDRIEKLGRGMEDVELKVLDYKTTLPRTQEEVDADLQLSVYAMAVKELYGEYPSELVMLYLNDDGVTEIKTERSKNQLQDAVKQISLVSAHVKEGEFKPRPSASTCKRCSYKGVCDVAAV